MCAYRGTKSLHCDAPRDHVRHKGTRTAFSACDPWSEIERVVTGTETEDEYEFLPGMTKTFWEWLVMIIVQQCEYTKCHRIKFKMDEAVNFML